MKSPPIGKAAVAVLLAAVVLAGVGAFLPACEAVRSPAGSSSAPPFSGVTLDGKTVSLEQYRGRPLLLVFMTSG